MFPCFAFESAHNALTSRFTGTVNHLKLLAERYLVNKQILHRNVRLEKSDKVSCNWIRSTGYADLLQRDGDKVYERCFINGLHFDSEVYTRSQANGFCAFQENDKVLLGKIHCFHDTANHKRFSYRKIKVLNEIKCPDGIRLPSFGFEVYITDNIATSNQRNILAKLVCINTSDRLFLVKLSNHFDHN